MHSQIFLVINGNEVPVGAKNLRLRVPNQNVLVSECIGVRTSGGCPPIHAAVNPGSRQEVAKFLGEGETQSKERDAIEEEGFNKLPGEIPWILNHVCNVGFRCSTGVLSK